jgi:hypothetical protein
MKILKAILKNVIRIFIVPLALSMIFFDLLFLFAKIPLVVLEVALKILDAQLKEIDDIFVSLRKFL